MNSHDIYKEAVGDKLPATGPTAEEARRAIAESTRKAAWLGDPETTRILEVLEKQFQDGLNNLLDMAMSSMASCDDVRRHAIAVAQLKQTIERIKKD
jgi:hypothetical protein